MSKQKKSAGNGKKARRGELVDQVKHPYITGQGLEPRRRQGESRQPGASPPSVGK